MRDDCCCNWEPFTLRCGPCVNQHHAKCNELTPGKRRSDYPSYPSTTDIGALFTIVLLLLIFAVLCVVFLLIA